LQDKIIYAGTTHSSYQAASDDLDKVGELHVLPKQVERLCNSIGLERCDERDDHAKAYMALPLVQRKGVPDGVTPPAIAVVGTDGGRLQIRGDQWGQPDKPIPPAAAPEAAAQPAPSNTTGSHEPAAAPEAAAQPAPSNTTGSHEPVPETGRSEERGRHWREDKIGLLMGMAGDEYACDPCPEIPDNFLDPTRMGKLVRELGKKVRLGEEAARPSANPDEETKEFHDEEKRWEPPEVKEKRLVASRQSWEIFGPLVAAAAWAMGLFGAARRAFIGDGSENNWTIWRNHFGSFVPILDFIHALTYIHAAAHAGRDRVSGWRCYVRWIRWTWRGEVVRVIEELRVRQQEVGKPKASEGETSVRKVIDRALTYLENNKERMKYAEYRQQGLPITSSYVESAVKQFNARVKGTEKFWTEEGAEGMLQLRADILSDDQPLDDFWERRQAETSGQRPYRRAA
jgi:hypothetical protein